MTRSCHMSFELLATDGKARTGTAGMGDAIVAALAKQQ